MRRDKSRLYICDKYPLGHRSRLYIFTPSGTGCVSINDDKRHSLYYTSGMEKVFEYDAKKNQQLKHERGISFEEVIVAIQADCLLDIVEHPNKIKYGHQKMYVVEINAYVYLVPFIENKKGVFLKTVFPSRKATKQYLKK